MIGKHAWVSHNAARWSSLDLRRRDWIGVLWDRCCINRRGLCHRPGVDALFNLKP